MQITPYHYAELWYETLAGKKASEWKEASQAILRHLHDTGRFSWLAEIAQLVTQLEEKHSGVTTVTVHSAHTLPEKPIQAYVQKMVGSEKVHITYKENPDLIGGIQVETTDKRWDASLSGALSQLQKKLTN